LPLLKFCNLTGNWAKNPNMLHNHALAKSIADAAWGLLIQCIRPTKRQTLLTSSPRLKPGDSLVGL
jgi:hypothetical protein